MLSNLLCSAARRLARNPLSIRLLFIIVSGGTLASVLLAQVPKRVVLPCMTPPLGLMH